MPTALRVLLLEDQPADAELLLHELRRAGFDPLAERVETEAEYVAGLDSAPDVILADYTLPQFNALDALHHLQERGLDIPFIVVTGAVSEEAAVECMKEGAADYLLKDRLSRLGQAVERALAQQRMREEKRQAEVALRQSEARYRAISELTSDYAYALGLEADGRFVCEWVTEAFARITGFTIEEIGARGWMALVHPEDRLIAAQRTQLLRTGRSDVSEFRIVTKTGATRLLRDHSRPVWDETLGRVVRVYGAAQDITERKEWEEALEHQALHDALTDLPNRTLLHDRLRQAILAAHRDSLPLALAVMDLDRFKEVNDALGHAAGDLLLQQVGMRLRRALRAADTVARLGGDEFAVLLPTANAEGATLAASKLLHALEQPFIVEGQSLVVGASVGIALCPEHGEDAETLLRRADVAMYVAKRTGSGCATYTLEHDQHSRGRLALVGELRQAIEHDVLVLHYQPLIDLDTRRTTCLEALVRWQHPRHGLLLPDQFIPLAEQTGLIKPLSPWVLNAALRQCQGWRAAGLDVLVAVNLSMRNVHDAQLPDTIAELLKTWDLDPRWLTVEITESAVMADPPRAMEILTRLRAMDVRIAIDDFGTGYSSLSYLRRLPVDVLKVDKSFVRDMATNESDATIVRSVIDLGHDLGLRVIAEGVEDEATWHLLAVLGCDGAQGNYLSRPLPPADLFRWMHESPWGLQQGEAIPS
jgi:diguanylate cyclase (GGDEF)-like protein/PAS domain S-box-containing protein